MPRNKLFYSVIAAFTVIATLYILGSVVQNEHETSKLNDQPERELVFLPARFNPEDWESWHDEEVYTPPGWVGVPLSRGNNLYTSPHAPGVNETSQELLDILIPMDTIGISKLADVQDLVIEYFPKIGWNGIIDTFGMFMDNS